MVVGVDLRVFQIGHQYRGIGAHISNFLREVSKLEEQPTFVFYEHKNVESGLSVIKDFLPNLDYSIRYTDDRLVGETFFQRERNSFKQRNIKGDAGLGDLSNIDVLLSIDFNLGVPRSNKVSTVLISYDLIPWVLQEHYLPSYSLVKKKTGSYKRALKAGIEKYLYLHKIKQANRRARKILAISEHTKKDLIKYLDIKPEKIETVLLGITPSSNKKSKSVISSKDINGKENKTDLKHDKFVFFMGGADRRRKIEDLVEAHDLVSKDNPDLKLILAGYDFQSFESIPDETAKNAIQSSKNNKTIQFAGFIDDFERLGLFSHAIAYVFPSIYEGFGLPILEAMDMNCPVITYQNSSIAEVGGEAVLYANSADEIAHHVRTLINDKGQRELLVKKGQDQVRNFSWEQNAISTLAALEDVN